MNRKKLTSLIVFIIAIVIIGGVSFAWFSYSKMGAENKLITGNIYLAFEDGNDTINLTKVFPESAEEARARNDNVLTFSISGINTSNKLLYYEILITQGDEIENKIKFRDQDLRFDLKKIEDNVETMLVENGTYQNINDTFMFGEVFGANISSEKTINYELRMWLTDEIIVSDTDPNRTYYATGENAFKNHYASVKLSVNGDFGNEIGQITYVDDNPTYQPIYAGKRIILPKPSNSTDFLGYATEENGEVVYQPGDVVTFMENTSLYPIYKLTFNGQIQKLCNDNNIAYVQKYDAANNGAAMDTPDGSGNEDVCYYTTTSTNRNSDAEQNSNVIFGDFCWQIVRTTADGGVKLLYNGLKTNDNKCTSDADTNNYSSNPRPSIDGVTGTANQSTNISGDKKYGTGFELYDDNGTTKFKLTNVSTGNWGSDYASLIGKYTCLNNTDTICTTLYYVGHKQSSTNASTVSYTISAPAHYSQLGTSPYNAYYDSPALVGYMYNDVYLVKSKFSTVSSSVINRSSGSTYYYGDEVNWDGTNYNLIDSSTNQAPTSTSTWANIRSTAGGKYTCKSSNQATGTSCATVYYIVADSNNSYMYSVPLSNNENKDKQVTWTYGTGVTKSGNTYTLTGTDTLTFKLADWYTDYSNSQYKNIYVCDDFTSTTCTTVRYISSTSNYQETHYTLNYSYYFANEINYDSNTNTYSYDTNGTIVEVYDWMTQYNTLNSNHYMCENYDSVNNTCGANNPMYYTNYTSSSNMYYAILEGVPNIETALVNMLSKDTGATVNRYNSAIKGIVDNWYKQNIEDKNLSSYLDNNAVFCNDRTITSLGGWSKTGSTTSNNDLRFKYYNSPSKMNATLACDNTTDRFSKTNNKAILTYPVGLLSEAERAMMYQGFARTGQYWWLGSPNYFDSNIATGRVVYPSGSINFNVAYISHGLRPAIVLKPGVEISEGNGTYNSPYIVNTNDN